MTLPSSLTDGPRVAERPAPTIPTATASSWLPRLRAVGAPLVWLIAAVAFWQGLVWFEWRPEWVLPGPRVVAERLVSDIADGTVLSAGSVTLGRALVGYTIAVVLGSAAGAAMWASSWVRAALGPALGALQTMPSVAWFPLAILLFQLGEAAIGFVVVLGAAPSVANGLVHAVDQVPPLWTRAGRLMGARGFGLLWHVVLPAAWPGFLAGLRQGWAFAWRSLMAGELLVIIGERSSIGTRLHFSRELSDAPGLLSWMIVVMSVGIVVDRLFAAWDARMRRQRGLLEAGQ